MSERPKQPPASISSWVNAVCSTPTPIHFGSKLTCVTQLAVIPLRRSPLSVLPTHVEAVRHLPEHAPAQPVVLVALLVGLDTGRVRPDRSTSTGFSHAAEATDGAPVAELSLAPHVT